MKRRGTLKLLTKVILKVLIKLFEFKNALVILFKINLTQNIIGIPTSKISLTTKFFTYGENAKIIFGVNFRTEDYVKISSVNGLLKIGKNVFLNRNCMIACRDKIEIGNNCSFGPNVMIFDHDHVFGKDSLIIENKFKTKPIKIGNNVWIGANSIILRGVVVGNNVVIAAGSTVKKSIPENVLYIEKKNVEFHSI